MTGFALAEDAIDLFVEGSDPPIEIPEQVVEFGNGFARQVCQFVLAVGQDLGNHATSTGDALGERESAIKQETSNLADDGGAMIDHALSRAMECLDVLLLNGFLRDEGHVRLPRGDADGLGVVPIVLLPTYEGLHILRADDLHLVPEVFKIPLPIESPRTGFKNHRAWLDLGDDLEKLISHHPTLQDNTAVAVDAVKLEYVLGNIDAEGFDSHCRVPSGCRLSAGALEGRAVHPIIWRAVDHEGEVLEVFVTKRRDRRAALKFLKSMMKRYGRPWSIVTDGLRSYRAATKAVGVSERHEWGRWPHNRAEISHQSFRRREAAMAQFRAIKTLQKFASVHASVHNLFNLERHLNRRHIFKQNRLAALAEWYQLAV